MRIQLLSTPVAPQAAGGATHHPNSASCEGRTGKGKGLGEMCQKALPGLRVPPGLHPSPMRTELALPCGDRHLVPCWRAMQELSLSGKSGYAARWKKVGVFLNNLPSQACPLSIVLRKRALNSIRQLMQPNEISLCLCWHLNCCISKGCLALSVGSSRDNAATTPGTALKIWWQTVNWQEK